MTLQPAEEAAGITRRQAVKATGEALLVVLPKACAIRLPSKILGTFKVTAERREGQRITL